MKRIIIAMALCIATYFGTNAQNVNIVNDLNIAPEEVEAVRQRIIDKVDELQDNIQRMAGIGTMSHKGKVEVKGITLKLFMGEGESYKERIPTPNGFTETEHDGVRMSVINSKYKKARRYLPMPSYFDGLIRNSEAQDYRYKKIIIESADGVRVDNFSRVGDGRYVATAHILQHFAGYGGDGRLVYHDYTAKTITIYINRIEEESPEGLVTHWMILLGDVDCDDIW